MATGTTTISSPLAATTLAKSGNGTLLLKGGIGTLTGLALNGGTVNLQPTGEAQITGPITGTGALRKSGGWDSLLTLGGANTFTADVTIAAGVLRLTRSDSLGTGPKTVTMTNGSDGKCRLILAGGSPGIVLPASIFFSTSNDGTTRPAFLNESGDNTIHGNFTLTTGGGGTRFTSAAGSLTLTGNLSPNTTGRVVHLGGAATGVISGRLQDRSNDDPLAMEKDGSGTWTFTGESTATGAASVLDGLLQITGSLAAPVTVQGGGTLGGTGTVAALATTSTVAGSAAGLAQGVAGIGKLKVAGTAVIGPRTRYTWELGDANGQPGTAWDLLESSSLQLTATPSQPLEITILPNQVANLPTSPRAFLIARGLGGITGFDPAAVILNSAAFPPAAGTWSVRQTGNTLELVLAPGRYNAWIATTGLTGSEAQPTADPDQDGLPNLIEFILGGQPNPALPNADSAHLAPSATLTSTHLEFRHRRTHAARDTPGLSIAVEYGGLTDIWTTATNGESGVTVHVNPDAYGPDVDELLVRLPLQASGSSAGFAPRLLPPNPAEPAGCQVNHHRARPPACIKRQAGFACRSLEAR